MKNSNLEQIPNSIGGRLLELRKEHDLTQTDVANAIGVTLKTYWIWERDEKEQLPSTDSLIRLSRLYDVSVDYLLCLTPYRHIDNEAISALTGLTDGSIEALRALSKAHEVKYDPYEAKLAISLKMLNFMLEDMLPELRKYEKDSLHYVSSLFADIWEYANGASVRATSSLPEPIFTSKEKYESYRKTRDFEEKFVHFELSDGSGIVYSVEKLYRQELMNNIRNYLEYFTKKVEEEKDHG